MQSRAVDLTLFDFPSHPQIDGWETFSPFVLQVSRALKLAKLPFTHKRVSLLDIGKVNPAGQLPVLQVGTERVTDSTRIMHRIEQLAPGSLLQGLDAQGRAEAWLWEELGDTAIYPYVLAARWVDERGWVQQKPAFFASLPAPLRAVAGPFVRRQISKNLEQRDFTRGGLSACYERMERMLESLDARAPETGFWLGESASVADVGLFAHLHALRMPRTPFTAEAVARRRRLSGWLDRVHLATRG